MDKPFNPATLPVDKFGLTLLLVGLIFSLLTIAGYLWSLLRPQSKVAIRLSRLAYSVTALSILGAFIFLAVLVNSRDYRYYYVFNHTGNDMHGSPLAVWWYGIAATWSGQEGSFALWAAWTAIIGFLVFWKAGKYEARVMPFFVSVLTCLCAIMLRQSPFKIIPPPDAAMLAAHGADLIYPATDGRGLNASLQNYWMTIHPPTIFFGFASLLVPYSYAAAAILWKDYEKWVPRVMPYALLSCATLGGGLFMGGYWAYETQGWHGFWAWDPVENASFFPWLAITALVHGLVVQKNRGGMARMNTFLGLLAFVLFIVGTLLTRSGALAQQDENGVLLSVHAFANVESSALIIMFGMLAFYGLGGLLLWLAFVGKMPGRPKQSSSLLSRDEAMWVAVWLMLIACAVVTLGTTQPLFQSWFNKTPSAPQAAFYNRWMVPLTLLSALFMGIAPWVAWRKTNSETFLRKLLIPWFAMLLFGFAMVFWVQGAERGLVQSLDPTDVSALQTQQAWINPKVQRIVVILLTATGFLAALSNSMLAFRVFRARPLSAGGWLAHVGIGLLIIGAVVSNTYERTVRIVISEGEEPVEAFGYKFSFERMTGEPDPGRPVNPDYDINNGVLLRVTPPAGEGKTGADGTRTFLVEPRWFVHNKNRVDSEEKMQRMIWPHIQKYFGHDLYVGIASDPVFAWRTDNNEGKPVEFKLNERKMLGSYIVGYREHFGEPGKLQGAQIIIGAPDGRPIEARPALRITQGTDENGQPKMTLTPINTEVAELMPDIVRLSKLPADLRAEVTRIVGQDKVTTLYGKPVIYYDKVGSEAQESLRKLFVEKLEAAQQRYETSLKAVQPFLKGATVRLEVKERLKRAPQKDPAVREALSAVTSLEDLANAFDKDRSKPASIVLDRMDAATKTISARITLPDFVDSSGNKQPGFAGRWEVPVAVTYKPWVNLVWIGVCIAVLGTMLAMVRRILDARKVKDDDDGPTPSVRYESWEAPEDEIPLPVAPAGAAPIVTETPARRPRLKPQT